MKTPLQRIRRGASFLGFVSVVGILGYYYLSGESLVESIYWFVITVSSVGYTENSQIDSRLQVFSIGVIVVGMSAAAYTIGGFIQMMTEGEIEQALGARRMTRGIEQLKDHVIICGFGRIGQNLAADLARAGEPLVVIDISIDRITEGEHLRHLVVTGNATEEETLLTAGIRRAKTLVVALDSDANNVFLTLTARNLNPDLRIIARGEQPSSEKKLFQAGADRVVLPAVIGARRISTMVTRPHAADLIEQVTDHTILNVELEELRLGPDTRLVGKTVVDTEANRVHRLLVVAIRRSDGEMIFNPGANDVFGLGDTIIAMGRQDDINRFREIHRV